MTAPVSSRPSRSGGASGSLASPRLEELRVRPRLDSGRSLEIESPGDGTDRLVVRSESGEVELDVTLTPEGPRLRFRAAALALECEGRLAMRCEELDLRATGRIYQECGELDQRVAGDARVSVRGELRQRAASAELRAVRGDVEIRANDDVRINGERVKLNP